MHPAILVVALTWLAWLPAGCVRAPDPVDAFVAQAGTTGRAAAATSMLTAYNAQELTFSDALDKAHALLEAGDPRATAFAGAVLDFGAAIEADMPMGGEYEIFWFRVGRLACRSAMVASEAGRVPEALTLVLAGPRRWQVEAYWLRYPDHDGLASMLLHANGRTSEALTRLLERGDLREEAQEAYEIISRGNP